jgi:hypothetical protein
MAVMEEMVPMLTIVNRRIEDGSARAAMAVTVAAVPEQASAPVAAMAVAVALVPMASILLKTEMAQVAVMEVRVVRHLVWAVS